MNEKFHPVPGKQEIEGVKKLKRKLKKGVKR